MTRKEMHKNSKHDTIGSIIFYQSNWNSSFDHYQINYKGIGSDIVIGYSNLPDSAKDFIKNSNEKEHDYSSESLKIFYFCI